MSYRSYVPWKSNLPSYKTSYSSRDDITSSDGKPIPRFGSITSPAAYRPSYSGGTYRSVPIKREPPLTSYVSRYSSSTTTAADTQPKEDKNKITTETVKKVQKSTSPTKYGASSNTLLKEPTITNSTGNISRYSRSRDPSPVTLENRSRLVTPSRVKSREPSPAQSILRGRSRDPSPSDLSIRSKIVSPVNSYASSYRLCPRSSSGYSSRYGSNNSLGRSPVATGAISYMSSSDIRARSVNRHHEQKETPQHDTVKEEESLENKTESEEENEEDESSDSKATVSVTVVTRGTSPTPPGSTVTRTRRIDLAKTIEKTIQRPVKKHKCVDKEIQSDRLDDSTRYSRFSATSRVSSIPWSPYTDNKIGNNMRYGSGSSKTSRDSSTRSELDNSKKDETNAGISRSSPFRSSTKKEKSKNKSSSSSAQNSTSVEALHSSSPKALPPTIPKTESPTKTVNSSSGSSKLSNKEFRKSALNIVSTDRTRKSRTPSASTDSEEKNEQPRNNLVHNGERSPSVGSETSATSNSSSSAQNATKRCHQPKIRTSSSTQTGNSAQMKSFNEDNSSVAISNESASGGISGSYNKNDQDIADFRNKQQQKQTFSKYQQSSSQHSNTNLNTHLSGDSSPNVSKTEGAKTYLLRKLGSVSNFFATRSQQDTSGETIYLDKTSSSNSTSNDLKQNVTIATTTASITQQYNPVTTATQTSNNSKTENTDIDDSSWWLNTSQQIDTESALDIKDEMKFKLRHIDSGELAWWMRNDEDDTVAEDIKTYVQDERSEYVDNSQNTENVVSPDNSWWINENENNNQNQKYKIRRNDSGEQAWWLKEDEPPWQSTTTNNNNNNSNSNNVDNKQCRSENKSNNSNNNSNRTNNSQNKSESVGDSIWSRNSSPEKKKNSYNSYSGGKIHRVDSGEKPWWMEDTNNNNSNESVKENNEIYKNYNNNNNNCYSPEKKNTSSYNRIHRVDSGEKPWWMEDTNNNNENNSNHRENNEISSNNNNNRTQYSPEKKNVSYNNKIHRVDSGEKPWWMEDTNNNENNNQKINSDYSQNNDQNIYKLRTTPSGDRPWWMANATKKNFQIRHIESGEKAWWLEDDSLEKNEEKHLKSSDESDNDDDNEIKNVDRGQNQSMKQYQNEILLPLGDRASPEGLEDPTKGRKSPYDNCNSTSISKNKGNNSNSQNSKKLFISRHTNIDELLGGSCRPLSPILDRLVSGKKMFLEEITPAQVRIHDSTAQMPVIQRMERDTASSKQQHSSTFGRDQDELDDAALQVYKDGDYGAYLDLESSLAEQAEEIEGLNSSRKNSLVVRTQLSVRVHAIIEKLLSSEGSELRRALFSLKQIFQEDKDLVHGFVALGGLNCLVRVGNVADQNYQNYILRALGQVMLYVDGMNGVMKHGPTIQWLYSLIASKYRLVVKTALKLLLVFVEYVESNCYLLVNAIHAVDNAQGTLPWSNIMKLLKDYENADTELLIYATSLINKTLSGLSDQDSFYDESDFLEQQGMEGVIQRYMSRPGTDLDLLDQLQLYEAVLKFEDGETDGIRVPDNSVRKTLRYRPSTDSAERRKSRRHSTGTSPHIQQQQINSSMSPTKRYTPPTNQGILDEDSSSSNNSNEFNGGVFRECKNGKREGAGVTPGLRRRRERAERQKTFMKEQQEALASGMKSPFDKTKDELNGLGQIVTAIPVHLQNGNDSPPDSLVISNENKLVNANQESDTSSTISERSSFNSSPLSNTSISVISNGFDRKSITNNSNNNNSNSSSSNNNTNNTNNNNNTTTINIMTNERAIPTIIQETNENSSPIQVPLIQGKRNPSTSSLSSVASTASTASSLSSSEFISNKNIVMRTNNNTTATVINGLKKNLNRNESRTLKNNTIQLDTKNENNNVSYNNHKIFENESNRLNNFYNQIASVNATNNAVVTVQQQQQSQHQQQQTSIKNNSILNQKNLNSLNNSECTKAIAPIAKCLQQQQQQQQIQQPIISNGNLNYANGHGHVKNVTNNNNNNGNNISNRLQINSPTNYIGSGGKQKDSLLSTGTGSYTNNGTQLVNSIGMRSPNQNNNDLKTVSNGNNLINGNSMTNGNSVIPPDILVESENENKKLLLQLKRDHTVKDLTQKLSHLPTSPQEDKPQNRIGDMTGLISKAKEGLAKSKSKGEISRSPSVDQEIKKTETKKSENEVHWEELVRNMCRPLTLCDLDFTDLNAEDEKDVLAPRGLGGNIPPPPPPIGMPPPPIGGMYPPPVNLPPPPTNLVPPPAFNYNNSQTIGRSNNNTSESTIKKNKKTVKLFWKEVREDMIPPSIGKTIWDELPQANVDIQKLEHLFESRAKDLMTKKQQEMNKNKEIIVLDHKRSNAINIAMTKLPPPRAIKAAILKMDATVVTREGIDKLLNMLPTEEERGKIQEAQMSNPELPLGSAEQFLLTLSSISELAARLKLWAFKLDFENTEKEIAEPLMDLKQGIELLRVNKTFKCILSTLLSIGIFLNGAPVKGFQVEYLAKVPEVKDTVHKHSLLHHLCHMVMESSSDTTDLYSEIGPITRASKADFTELAHNLNQMETECKASWDRLKLIAKHDCPPQLKQKLVDFLADCAERIIILQIVHRRVINRYRKFLLWLGVPQHRVAESKPNEFCRILSEFALEYRTTRERVHQQMEKKANHRERNKTRGKMIIDVGKFRTQEDRADAELKQLLGSPNPGTQSPDGTLTWRRRRIDNLRSPLIRQTDENFTDGDDEILESLVKTATKAPGTRTTPRERKRTRHADRKSLRRTLKNGLTEEEKQHVASLIKTY